MADLSARTYTTLRDVEVPMSDGIGLLTDVYLPAGEGPFPTLLQRTPYDRSDAFGTQFIVQMTVMHALDVGFAVVIQDTRGRFASPGEFEPYIHEGRDGADSITWICEQSWSDGRVATYGASYVGVTQTTLAMKGVEGHLAMAPFLTSGDLFAPWTYRGGALQLGFVYLWLTEALGPIDVEKRQLAVDHPARATLATLLADPRGAMDRLPTLSEEIVELAPYVEDWLSNPTPSSFWSDVSLIDHVGDVRTKGLHIGGFNDIFLEGNIKTYQGLRQGGVDVDVRDGQYLILGPWSHGNIGDWQGQEWLGYAAAAPVQNLTGVQLDFFTAVMAGTTPDLPRVRYFTSGTNEWHTADDWPPPNSTQVRLFLASDGRLNSDPGDPGQDSYDADPSDPVPTVGGPTFLPGLLLNRNDGPQDQTQVEAREDVLVYRGERLTRSLEVTGLVTVQLHASSSAEDCDWTARLVDIDEDGRSIGIVDGILRARYRHGWDPTPLLPGEAETFSVELGHTSHTFRSGHRIGLQIASSNFPRFDRNPQRMIDPVRATAEDFVVARQTLLWGEGTPSCLSLPVVTRESAQ